MSSQPKTKRTVAQLRAQKEKRKQDVIDGTLILQDMVTAYQLLEPLGSSSLDERNAILLQANRACELLRCDPGSNENYRNALHIKAEMHKDMGQQHLALATYRRTDDLFEAAERKGLLHAADQDLYADVVARIGYIYMDAHQLESAKSCFLRILAWPRTQGLVNVSKCCEEAITLLRNGDLEGGNQHAEQQFLAFLADAAEGQGNINLAREYDKQSDYLWLIEARSGGASIDATIGSFLLAPSNRRKAIEFLAAGKPHEAIQVLANAPNVFAAALEQAGINIMMVHVFEPVLAAIKVLTDAMVQTGSPHYASEAERIRAEAQETETIVSAYWEGVLEETRRELSEKRRGAAAHVAAGGTRVAAGEEERATKNSKAAKRKQQKRKAQQQKKAAEMAEAAAAAAAARGEAVAVSQKQLGQQVDERAQQEHADKDDDEEEGKVGEQAVTAGVAALAAMATSGIQGQEEEEEEEEDE